MPRGFDNNPLNTNLIVAHPFEEGSGAITHDVSKSHIPMTLSGGTIAWASLAAPLATISTIDMVTINTDFLEASALATANLDFIGQNFSMCCWILLDTLAAAVHLIDRGTSATDGWFFTVDANGALRLGTNGAALVETYSADGEITVANWWFVAATRSGAAGVVYKNSRNIVALAGVHANPVTAAVKLHYGVDVTEGAGGMDGHMWYPRIWDSRVLTDLEVWQIFESERSLFDL